MTKYNIRLRRKALSQGQIERHKDFRSLRQFDTPQEKSSSITRIVLIVVAVLLLMIMIVLGVIRLRVGEPELKEHDGFEVFEEFKEGG